MTEQLKLEIDRFKQVLADFPWQSKEAYADWLSQTNHFVSETTTFLTLAAAKSERNSKLQLRFIEHAAEEKGHDKLLLMDLKGLGLSIMPEHHATAAFYQPQYFWLHQRDSRAFFGYIILLEGLAAVHGPMMYERVAKAHGKSAAAFLKVHSSEDTEHIEKAYDELETFPAEIKEMVLRNFMNSARCYQWILTSIVEKQQKLSAAA